ncbi:MAG TPA: hypothetical protein VHA56_02360 [Mucilaginibacter sp.]|nr:hypothetical protein [Mucilaginibacter sp.]
MKKNKFRFIHAWILLLCFVAGQIVVYAHQHKYVQISHHAYGQNGHPVKSTITEKCQLCDAMHHNSMTISSAPHANPVIVATHIYQTPVYNFTTLSLILAGGRAPPFYGYTA